MRMVILGPPAAGKGTQAEAIMKKLNILAVSTGDLLREAIIRQTPVGLQAKAYMDVGELVPDEVIIGIILDRLSRDDCKGGYILDGVPRTIVQAETLEKKGIVIDVVLLIEISDEEAMGRIGGRRACPVCNSIYHVVSKPPAKEGICDYCHTTLMTRKDDTPETIRHRLQTYHTETKPLISHYEAQGKLRTVYNIPGIAQTTAAVFNVLGI